MAHAVAIIIAIPGMIALAIVGLFPFYALVKLALMGAGK